MIVETIGNAAGLVWDALQNGEKELNTIKKSTKLNARDLHMALGWLAREDKLSFKEEGKSLFISLK